MSRSYTEKKQAYFQHMEELLDQYKRLVFVNVDNVQSQQMHNIRKGLRGKAEILMGKNTMMRKILRSRYDKSQNGDFDCQLYEKIVSEKNLVGNVGIIFTNEDLSIVKDVIMSNRIQAPARVGAIAPLDVVIPAGNTGLEPGATSFFQALQINTKIARGAVEIVTEKKVLAAGDKVDNSTAALLQKLKIKPFFYGLQITKIFDNGEVYDASILELNDDFFNEGLELAINNVTRLSLATGIPTELSLPHVATAAFKNILSICLGTELSFEEFNGAEIVDAIKSGKSLGVAAAAAEAASAADVAAPAAAAAEPEEEEDDDMGLGLFD